MAAVCETLQVHADESDSEAGALDDLLGLGGALADVADASDDDAGDAIVDDAFARRARGAGASVSGAKGWAVLDDALNPKASARKLAVPSAATKGGGGETILAPTLETGAENGAADPVDDGAATGKKGRRSGRAGGRVRRPGLASDRPGNNGQRPGLGSEPQQP